MEIREIVALKETALRKFTFHLFGMAFRIPKNVVKGNSRLNFASRSASVRNFKSSSSKSLIRIMPLVKEL